MPAGPGSVPLAPRPRRSGAITRRSSASASDTQQRWLAVTPWTARAVGAAVSAPDGLQRPTRSVPPRTGTSRVSYGTATDTRAPGGSTGSDGRTLGYDGA